VSASATGDGRAKEAAERALRSPLIDAEITGARGILLSIAGGDDLTLVEVNDAAEVIRAASTDDTNIIFGATVDDRLAGQVWVTVVATGFGGRGRRAPRSEGSPQPRPSMAPEIRARLDAFRAFVGCAYITALKAPDAKAKGIDINGPSFGYAPQIGLFFVQPPDLGTGGGSVK